MKLKCLSSYDTQKVRRWRNEQLDMLRTSFPLTEEMQEGFYKNIICNRQSNARFWGMWIGAELIGMIGVENIELENRLGEISLLLNPEYNTDINLNKALQLLLDKGFNYLNLENIYTEIYDCHPKKKLWHEIAKEYNCKISILQNRKYYNGKYYNSTYINFNKEDFNENSISQSS